MGGFEEVGLGELQLARELLSQWPHQRWSDRRLLLGVSGGADSVALLLALNALAQPGQLVVAHFNHGWRGQESDGDANFVQQLCQRLDRQCLCGVSRECDKAELNQIDAQDRRDYAMLAKEICETENDSSITTRSVSEGATITTSCVSEDDVITTRSVSEGSSETHLNSPPVKSYTQLESLVRSEESARYARYKFFQEAAYQVGASYVVTAHTANDRAETVLHNLLRGTGLAGAASLTMFRSFHDDLVLVRPLLKKSRADVENFLTALAQDFRTDSSNTNTDYSRNFLRQQVLPMLAARYPSATEHLVGFSEIVEEYLDDLELLARRWIERVGQSSDVGSFKSTLSNRWHVPQLFIAPLSLVVNEPWSVVQAALRSIWSQQAWPSGDMSRSHWQALRQLCATSEGTLNLPAGLRAEAMNGYLVLGPFSETI